MKTNTANPGLVATTPFPNILLDEVMPHLKDTEWRMLCVVVRQTLGWRDAKGQGRKERDWLTRTQLKARTGRNSEALSLAIDALIRQGYMTASNDWGILLATPEDRRKNHGRIHYGLSSGWRAKIGAKPDQSSFTKSEQMLTQCTKTRRSSIFLTAARQTELVSSGKPYTTKETRTKENETKENSLEAMTQRAVHDFSALFQEVADLSGKSKPNITLSPPESIQLETLLKRRSPVGWTPVLQMFFESNISYITSRNYSLSAFLNSCNIFLTRQLKTKAAPILANHLSCADRPHS